MTSVYTRGESLPFFTFMISERKSPITINSGEQQLNHDDPLRLITNCFERWRGALVGPLAWSSKADLTFFKVTIHTLPVQFACSISVSKVLAVCVIFRFAARFLCLCRVYFCRSCKKHLQKKDYFTADTFGRRMRKDWESAFIGPMNHRSKFFLPIRHLC